MWFLVFLLAVSSILSIASFFVLVIFVFSIKDNMDFLWGNIRRRDALQTNYFCSLTQGHNEVVESLKSIHKKMDNGRHRDNKLMRKVTTLENQNRAYSMQARGKEIKVINLEAK